MKYLVITMTALLAAGAAQAQTMSTQPAAPPASSDPMASPSTTTAPAMGNSMAGDNMTESMARQKLSGAGYGSITGLKRNSDGQWEAMTKKAGKQQRVTVASDGTLTPQPPM